MVNGKQKKSGIKTHKYRTTSSAKVQHSWKLIATNGNVTACGSGLNRKPTKKYFVRLAKQLLAAAQKL